MSRCYGMALRKVGAYNDQPGTVNPASPDTSHWLYEPGMVAYILKTEKGGLKVATSHGALGADCGVGTSHHTYSDQSASSLGYVTVVGIATWNEDGTVTTEGTVPSKKITWSVFK